MGLGYALLHPGRVELALVAEPQQAAFDDLSDIVMSLVGGGDPGAAARAFVDSVRDRVTTVGQLFSGLAGPGGPLGPITSLLSSLSSGSASGLPDLAAWLDRVLAFLEALAPETLRQKVTGWLDALLGAVPVLDSHQMFLALRDLVSQALEAFEKPFLDGRRDAGAHRLVRAATVAHSYLDSMLENIEDALGGFSLRPIFDQFVEYVLGAMSFTGMDRVIQAVRDVRDALGPILAAMSNLSLSLTVSVSVGGPDGQPAAEPTWRDDGVPTPHMPGHALWWTDLITNVFSTFNLLWELIRTAPWHRPVEVILSAVEIAWQLVRTLVRAICPAKLNQWPAEARWFFTDQAQFVIGLILRFGGSFHDAFAAPNYFLGAGLRILRYYGYVLSPRMFYLFARSWTYLQSWKNDPWVLDGGGHPTTTKAPISIIRYAWALWPVNWAFAGLLGSVQPWEAYNIAELTDYPLTIVLLAVGAFGGWALSLAVAAGLGGVVFDYPLQRDFGLFAIWAVATAWVVLLITMSMWGVNKLQAAALPVGISLAVVLAALFIAMGAVWGNQSNDADPVTEAWLPHIFVHLTGIMVFGVFGFIAWWYYVNEGRDAEGRDTHGFWNELVAESSPYSLPYPGGQTYFCGQANHGVFSHFQSSAGNRYSYDFNDDENKPIWAAREGVVVEIREVRPNGSGEPNFIVVQHVEWAPGHDPGSDKERALTYSNYWHLSQNHLWVREGQRVGQGQYIADLDDTGISALHHLHFGVNSFQRDWFHGPEKKHGNLDNGDGGNIPIVFRDPSLRGFRNYPILFSWLPGGGHRDGKPIAMSFYESSNQPHEPEPQPVAVRTSMQTATGVANHQHEIHLDASVFVNGALPAGDVWVRTTPHEGHFHAIKLTRARLLDILQRRDLAGLTTSEALGHTHTLENDPHGVTTHPADNTNNPPKPVSTRSNITPLIVHPPPGQVQARNPGPYDLLGEQLVLRVNDRVTEYYLYGASRAAATGNVALDRAPEGDLEIDAAGASHTSTVPAGALAVRQAVRALNIAARLAGRNEAFRAVPVLIIETRRRGGGATLQVTGGSAADALGLTGQHAVGTGVGTDFDGMSASALGDVLRDGLNQAWAADSVHVTAAMTGGTLALHASSHALEFATTQAGQASSTPRIAAVLNNLYRHAGNAPGTNPPVIQATGKLPLGTGRLVLRRGNAGWSIPVLGTPARVQLDPAHAALSGAGRSATPLRVRLRATANAQEIWFRAGDGGSDPGDSTPEAMARRITAEAEGVRAWVAGGQIVIETVAAGQAVDLYVDKDAPSGSAALSVTNRGTAPEVSPAPAGTPVIMDDSTALPPDLLRTIIEDAKWRAGQGPNPNAITASVDAFAIVLERAGATLTLVHDGTGLGFAPDGGKLRSQPLTTAQARPGGWLDVRVGTGPVLRAVLDAEPARIDGTPLLRLPGSGTPGSGTIDITVNGTARSATFTANVRNAFDVATELGNQIPEILVRVGYRLAVETVLPHGPSPRVIVNAADAAAGAGFGHALPLTVRGWGEVGDPLAVISLGSGQLGRRAAQHLGPLIPGFTVSDEGNRVRLTARTPENVLAVHALDSHGVHDPLRLAVQPGGPAHQLASDAIATAIDLGSHCVGYRIAVEDAGATPAGVPREILAETIVQISAAPATAATTLAPLFSAMPAAGAAGGGGAILKLVITPPAGAASTAAVDLRGVTDLEEVADRINAAVPEVAAWADQTMGYATTARGRLHVQTRGGGKQWKLRLQNHHVLAALGFNPAIMLEVPDADPTKPPAYVVEVDGRGNVNDGAAVTLTELRTIFDQAAGHITQLDNPTAVPPVRRSFLVEHGPVPAGTSPTTARDLVLHSAAGAVTLSTSPPYLADRLHVTADADRTRIAPGSTHVALDNGVIRVSVGSRLAAAAELFGWSALLVAPNPLPTGAVAQQQLAYLDTLTHANGIDLAVDHGRAVRLFDFPAPPASIPASATGFEAVIAHLGQRVPGIWFGVVEQGGARHFAMQSRTRGRQSQIALDLRSIPTFGLLGWNQADGTTHSVPGGGNVDSLDNVTLVELKRLLEEARGLGAGPQALLDPRVSSGNLQVVPLSPGAFLQQTSAPAATPGGLAMTWPAGRTDVLETAYAARLACNPGLAIFLVAVGLVPRWVRALVWGTPARLPEMRLPSQAAQLEGKKLSLRVNGTQHEVTFDGIVGPADRARARVVAQIEAGCAWNVRAHLRGNTLVIETRREGGSATIALLPIANDARGALGVTATGEVPGTAGAGSVPDLAAVEADHYRAALASSESAFASEAPFTEQAVSRDVVVDLSGCEPRDVSVAPDAPRFARIASDRHGCMSSVIPLVDAPSLALDRTLARGPAVRASVKLDAFAGERPLPEGELEIVLQGNPVAPDHPPEIRVMVRFAAGNYTAQKIADLIHQELFQRGAGMAACYPDNTVVVETMVNGIVGSISLPGPATTPDLASELHAGTPVSGWPGMGSGGIRAGFRSEPRAPTAGTPWKFRTDRNPATPAFEADFTVPPGGTIRDCARGLHAALGAATGPGGATQRIGIATVGADGCLYIEATGAQLVLFQVNGEDREADRETLVQKERTLEPRPAPIGVAPARVGEGFEEPVEPGLGLRRTDTLRTVRYVRDGFGAGLDASMNDLGWVRSPSYTRTGGPAFFWYWPAGRYRLALRADAARINDYDGKGDMIASHGQDPADPSRGFVHQARYWVGIVGTRQIYAAGAAVAVPPHAPAGTPSQRPDVWAQYRFPPFANTLSFEPVGLRRVGSDLAVEIVVWWR